MPQLLMAGMHCARCRDGKNRKQEHAWMMGKRSPKVVWRSVTMPEIKNIVPITAPDQAARFGNCAASPGLLRFKLIPHLLLSPRVCRPWAAR